MKPFITALMKKNIVSFPPRLTRKIQSEGDHSLLGNVQRKPFDVSPTPGSLVGISTEKGNIISTADALLDETTNKLESLLGGDASALPKQTFTRMVYVLAMESAMKQTETQKMHEQELGQRACDEKIRALKSFHMAELSNICQRWALEQFFSRCVEEFMVLVAEEKGANSNHSTLETAAKSHMTSKRDNTNFNKKAKITMMSANRLLCCEPVRRAIFKRLGMDDVPFPHLPAEELYGTLSFGIHHPRLHTIYMSADTSDEIKAFFSGVAQKLGKEAVEYDPASAHQGKQIFGAFMPGHVSHVALGTGTQEK